MVFRLASKLVRNSPIGNWLQLATSCLEVSPPDQYSNFITWSDMMISPLLPVCPTMQTWHQVVVDPHVHTRHANTYLICQTVPTSLYSYWLHVWIAQAPPGNHILFTLFIWCTLTQKTGSHLAIFPCKVNCSPENKGKIVENSSSKAGYPVSVYTKSQAINLIY